MQKKLDTLIKENENDNSEAKEEIGSLVDNIHQQLKEIETKAKTFQVKGCISVGEMKLRQAVAPKLIDIASPLIQQHMETMIKILGESFHTKQFLLRLIFADIAKRQENA